MSRTKRDAQGGPATLREVAAAAGVSTATASRVLNGITGKATAETVTRVRDVAVRLAYRPVAAARELRRGVAELVVLLAPNLANPTMATLAAAIETALRPEGIGVVLCDTHDEVTLQDDALAATRALRPRATVLLGAVASPALARHLAEGERLLFVGRRCPHAPRAPFVGIDDHAAGRAVAEALLAGGCRRLGVVHGPFFSSATADRVAAFRARAGRALAEADVLGGDGLDHLRIGAAAASRWRGASRPDGIMCTSDLIALSAHRMLATSGSGVPPVIWGFDGSPLNRWVAPWLSSVALPYAEIGAAARDWVVGGPDAAREAILPFRLDAVPPGPSA
jgi:LacI family transcriptional regulator